jgi:hypothetical protein
MKRNWGTQINEWEKQAAQLESSRTRFAAKKKTIEDKLVAEAHVSKVLKWIKKEGDPELGLEDIRIKVTRNGRYDRSAQWFFDEPEFQAWSSRFQTTKSQHPAESKSTLWVNGTYGTGKTTLM